MNIYTLLFIVFAGYISIYLLFFFLLRHRMEKSESAIVNIFLAKVAKIPALIEVMRPYVIDEKAFDTISSLHSETMIHRYETIYDLLEHNGRIQNQFLFLLQLSVRIPELQTHEYFLYIRDFIITYERDMTAHFSWFNRATVLWNIFVLIKNWTIIGLILPGRKQSEI
jgi:hypothetical protein